MGACAETRPWLVRGLDLRGCGWSEPPSAGIENVPMFRRRWIGKEYLRLPSFDQRAPKMLVAWCQATVAGHRDENRQLASARRTRETSRRRVPSGDNRGFRGLLRGVFTTDAA